MSYKKALEVNPYSAIALYHSGLAYSRKGMIEEAKIQLRKALQIDPEMRDAARLISQYEEFDHVKSVQVNHRRGYGKKK